MTSPGRSSPQPAAGRGAPLAQRRLTPVFVILIGAFGCAADAPAERRTPDALTPQGSGARIVFDEMVWHAAFGGLIFALVVGLLLTILWRKRRPVPIPDDAEARGIRWIWAGGIVLPIGVLTVIFSQSLASLASLEQLAEPDTLEVEIIGHRWWWEIHYPDEGIVTANELRIPAGEPVRLTLTSHDVIHAFWVPELHPKLDLLPGRSNEVWVESDRPGTYRGICAEYCGLQHARMQFLAVVMDTEDFDEWAQSRAEPPSPPTTAHERRGQDLFMNNCAMCHAIDGTLATGTVGPDLSDLAGRLSLAAGIYPNNTGNLSGWVSDPQGMKPGALMPSTDLDGDELQALLAYLEILR